VNKARNVRDLLIDYDCTIVIKNHDKTVAARVSRHSSLGHLAIKHAC
jgi:predicted ABC-type transport system involved in lysophospholipase L1 biosynthesis ATPase subunit